MAEKYLKKGAQVYIEGALETRKWQDQQGQDRYTTEITVRAFRGSMEMLGGNNGNSNANDNTSNQGGQAAYGGGYDGYDQGGYGGGF